MAWSWSHTVDAYENARTNLAGVGRKKLDIIYAEWQALDTKSVEDGEEVNEHFSQEAYAIAIKAVRGLPVDVVIDYIWERAEAQATCDNGGFHAWVCPYGCHTVPFDAVRGLRRIADRRGYYLEG